MWLTRHKIRRSLFCTARVKSRRLLCLCTFTLHVVFRGIRTCKHTESQHSILTSLDLNILLIFSRSPPAFIFIITAANTKGATDGKNLSSIAYIITPLKQQFTGCFWSLLYFLHLQQDAWLCLYFCLIDFAFVPSHAEWKTEKTWPSGSSSHPAHHLNSAGEGSESKTCKQAPVNKKEEEFKRSHVRNANGRKRIKDGDVEFMFDETKQRILK